MCDYQGYEFGASYPDSVCIDGKLFDADNCDGDGSLFDPGEDIPCPMCRPEDARRWWTRRMDGSYKDRHRAARSLVADIRRNRKNGTEPWKTEVA